nr:FAD-binding oxidoreductase [Pseudomonas syringae group genomosp. 3]
MDLYPSLQENVNADVCIIGGGFSGINTAIELAERGVSVVLIEAKRIGWGASGRNGGQLIQGFGHDVEQFRNRIGDQGVRTLKLMGIEAVDIVRERIEKNGIQCDLRWGYCDLANKPAHLEHFKYRADDLQSLGYAHLTKLVQRDEIRNFVGSELFIGGLVDMGSGHLHPLKLLTAEAQLAARLGVRIFEGTPAYAVMTSQDGVVVSTQTGLIRANNAVIACNAYINGLEPTLASKVLPAGSYIVATEPLSLQQQQNLLPHNMAMSDNQVGLNYFRLSADGRMMFGGACHYSGRDPKDIAAYMAPSMHKVFPQLKTVKTDYAWSGMIGIGANRLPQVGRLTNRPQIYYAQAYSGHGVNATHMAARLVAESIVGTPSDRFLMLNSIPHLTFPGGRYLRSPLLALGMLWHRMRDFAR